jgi:predicted tellurium resistance membrane protein TerC
MSPPLLTTLLSGLLVLIGVAMIVRTIAAGGGALATGVVLGLLFAAAGAGRLWAERRR